MKNTLALSGEALNVFQSLPDLYLILSPDLFILTASNAYLRATFTQREEIVGRYVFDVFPDNPLAKGVSGVNNLHTSLKEVLSTKKPHRMAMQQYDVPHSKESGRGFVQKYWLPLNTPVLDEQDKVQYIIHKVEDVTELVIQEHELKDLKQVVIKQQANQILNTLQAAIIELDFERRFRFINRTAEQYLKIDAHALLGKRLEEVFPKTIDEAIYAAIQKALVQREKTQTEYFSTFFQTYGFLSSVPSLTGAILQFYDRSDLREAQQELKKSKDLLRSVFDASPSSIAVFNILYDEQGQVEDFEILLFNSTTLHITGLSEEEVFGKRFSKIFPHAIESGVIEEFKKVASSGQIADFTKWYEGEGMHHYFRFRATKVDNLLVVTTDDITARIKAEQEVLRMQEELAQRTTDKYLTLFNSMDQGFCIIQLIFDEESRPIDCRYVEINPAFEKQTGLKDALGRTFREVIPGIEPFWFDIYGKVALTGESIRFENYVKTLGIWFDVYAFRSGKREDHQVAVLFSDITERKRADDALRKSEERLQKAISIPTVGVIFFNLEGCITDTNEAIEQMSGYSREDFLSGRVHWDEVSPPEFREVTLKSREELLMKGQNTPYEKQNIRPDGSRWWGLFSGKRLSENECVEFVLDMTEIKQAAEALQESEERFRTMAEASGILIAHTDETGNAIYFNGEWFKATGRTMEELLQYGWADFFHEEDAQPFVEAYQRTFAERKVLKREFRLANQKGEYRWHLAVVSPRYSPGGRFAGFISSCIDITEQKEAEQKLQALSRQLAAANEEVKASNNELASTNAQLLRINADMDNFIYTASHDLKAPINNIDGLVRLLTRRLEKGNGLDEALKGIIELIEGSIKRFKETVADLSEIAKVQKQHDAVPEAVDLPGVLRDILLDLQSYIEQSEAYIEQRIDSCPSIIFPKKNLKSILYNLISNAIKYGDPSRKPHIIICCQNQDQYQVLSVQDNGLGLNTKDENRVFGMFKRQHTHVEGSGVGLYIVKKMIENAGGKITVESQIGEGSTFKVYFKR